MQRTAVNPWSWSLHVGFNQAEIVTDSTATLYVSGQTATDADGRPLFPGDMAAQIRCALDNLDAVLAAAEMSLANVVRLTIYATDVDAMLANYGVLGERLGRAGALPPSTLLGVTRLAMAGLMVEIEATAVR